MAEPTTGAKPIDIIERAKEEIGAIAQTISSHHHHHKETHGTRNDIDENTSLDDVKAPNVFERAKEEIEALAQTIHEKLESKLRKPNSLSEDDNIHSKETHGTSNKIDENTPVDSVKGPNVFQRAKEELEAIVQTIHPKKEVETTISSSEKKGGFWSRLGALLEKACAPGRTKND